KSYAQLMHRRGDKHPELISESVQAINTEADRMQQLVEQLLLLVKNENDLTYKSVDIVELCEKTVATFRGAYTRSIQFKHPSESVLVHGNEDQLDRKSTRLNSSHVSISYAVFCLKKKKNK